MRLRPVTKDLAEIEAAGLPAALAPHIEFGRQLARQSVSESTLKSYAQDLRQFDAWCQAQGVPLSPDAPAPVGVVRAYLSAMYRQGRAVATIRRHTSAISWAHRKRRHADPTKDESVVELLRGIAENDYQRKVEEGAPSQKRAIGLRQRDADRIADKAEERAAGTTRRRLQAIRDLAVLQIARGRLMRASEVVSLKVRSITVNGDTASLTFRRIKTRSDEKTFELGPDAALAVTAWLAELAAAGVTDGPLFRPITRDGRRIKPAGIYRQEVTRIVKRMVRDVKGLEGRAFSAHSIRRGKAQDLRHEGATVIQVQAAGGWDTPRMVNVYTDSEDTSDDAALAYDRKHARHK
jgi:site-specific recombinase XerD